MDPSSSGKFVQRGMDHFFSLFQLSNLAACGPGAIRLRELLSFAKVSHQKKGR